MGNFTEIFKNSLPDLESLPPQQRDKITGNITAGLIDAIDENSDQMKALIAELHTHNAYLGSHLTNGNCAYLFELTNAKGVVVPEAVVRIEPAATHGDLESAAMIQPILKLGNEEYIASIVPKAVKPEWPVDLNGRHRVAENPFEIKDLQRTLSVLAAEGKVDQITDMEVGQIMALPRVHAGVDGKLTTNGDVIRYRDGMPAGYLVDMNSIKFPKLDDKGHFIYDEKTGDKILQAAGTSLGTLRSFAQRKGLNREELMNTKADAAEIAHLREEQAKLTAYVAKKVEAAGISLDRPPEKIRDIGIVPHAQTKEQGHAVS